MSFNLARNRPLVLDTNVAVLFYVGATDPQLIGKHQRTSDFDHHDFRLLWEIVSEASKLVVSPYVAAEVSNLALDKRNIGQSARNRISEVMREHLETAAEAYVECAAAVKDENFDALGVTDSALLLILRDNPHLHLLTDDFTLSQIGQSRKLKVHNFSHIRDRREDFRA